MIILCSKLLDRQKFIIYYNKCYLYYIKVIEGFITMARKESVTKSMILEAAFELTKEEGIEAVTARKLAAKMNCSTQPIFRVYENMSELYAEIYQTAIDYFSDFYDNFNSEVDTPFIHLGLCYIDFARTEENIFKLLFLSKHREGKSLYELLNGKSQAVGKEINLAIAQGCDNPSGLFMKIWIFIHGCACMVQTGDYDLTIEETVGLLKDVYNRCSARLEEV